MVLHKTNAGSITFDADTPAVIATFTNFMNSEQFQTFMKTGLIHLENKLKSNENVLWLADTSGHKIQPRSDTEWVATIWTPKAVRAGLTHIAFVMPKDVFAQLSIENYAKDATHQKGVTIKMFDDIEKAKHWYKKSIGKKPGIFF